MSGTSTATCTGGKEVSNLPNYTAIVTLTTSVSITADNLDQAIKVAFDHVDTQFPNATEIDGLMVTKNKEGVSDG